MASDSDPIMITLSLPPVPGGATLPCPAEEIFNAPAIARALSEALTTGAQDRAVVVPILNEARKSGMAAIEAALMRTPAEARPVTRAIAWLTDCLVTAALAVADTALVP
ncbi:MAG: [protein-PII] uridylyltransferase, partial [Rhodobacteraceae bacterium]|nr:[protein-PII] uridylyltransferase [Paracoccaceae bacterium]